ncbi:hypothetical protein ACFY19_09870 [Streptosporangium saharense]|uniref:Uncharacterized protein n=1 Tax=Streptosporangium saharense TaxID=1706840 RepID=A0A7W7QM71_9ACTN|nr:hypothetical protein [Streptosporangium saharense]MBB4916175.1 hypothetical protein [Streptosporangium saharense]
MKASKWAAALSTTALLTTGVLMGTVSGANAAPDSCTTSVSGSTGAATGSSYCASGTGEHQVSVVFRHLNPWIPGLQQISGPWKPAGQTSSVTVVGTIVSVSVLKR